MLTAFKLKNNRLIQVELDKKPDDIKNAIWIDLVNPSKHERNTIYNYLGQNLASSLELLEIEASARFFEDSKGLHIHSFFFYEDSNNYKGNSTVAFTIHNNKIYSLREHDISFFRTYITKVKNKNILKTNAYHLLLDLFEVKIDHLADQIEHIYSVMEKLSCFLIYEQQRDEFKDALERLSLIEDIEWKVRLCLMDTQRAINFLVKKSRLKHIELERAREILHDIDSLIPHNESLFQKINFLTQAAIGFISIEQNRIIKIFSVVSVIFLPPTLVASSYGMNFRFMPELHWRYGYPIAIFLMIFAGLVPYIFFKIKKWL